MKLLPRGTLSSIILVVSLGVILVVLAILQYRWSGQVSEAEHERMQTSLLASMSQFRLQFNNEFQQLGFPLQPDSTILMHKDWKSYAESCSTVLKDGSNSNLVQSVYLWVPGIHGGDQLLKLNRNEQAFEAVSWPSELETIRDKYGRFFSTPLRPAPEIRPFMWTMLYRIPLMLQPLGIFQPPPNSSGAVMQFAGYLMVQLSLDAIRSQLLPELAKKYFEGSDGFIYQVAITGGRDSDILLYKSDPHLTAASFANPDARVSLFESPRERFGPMGPQPDQRLEPPDRGNPPPPMIRFRPEPPSPGGRRGMGLFISDNEGSGWELVVKHRQGSLEAAVSGLRRRNLAISFGSLLLLAISMGLIIVSARRAQRLARLQIDFVAGISHELRTPLTVICSAGDNLAEGVVADSGHSARKYGELIRDEGRKLAGMIERILQYASLQRGRSHYSLRPENINEIAANALKQLQPAIAAAGFTIETTMAPELPRVSVDAAALSHAIQNLIQNALKYSGESRWLAVRTSKVHIKRGSEVQLIVEDRGTGIGSEDLPHIFEPFYRGGAAAAEQIHGTGLGLFMVREALTSMGGSITAKSTPGKGSAFTIHLPALVSLNDDSSSAASEGQSAHAVQNITD